MALRIKALREEKHMSQEELAARANIPQYTISRLETGALRARLELMIPIAKALNVTLDALTDETEEPLHATS